MSRPRTRAPSRMHGVAHAFRMLAHPTRRQILIELRRTGMTTRSLAEKISVSISSVRRHLDCLRTFQAVVRERTSGQYVYGLAGNTSVRLGRRFITIHLQTPAAVIDFTVLRA